jgi:hypothetical protein
MRGDVVVPEVSKVSGEEHPAATGWRSKAWQLDPAAGLDSHGLLAKFVTELDDVTLGQLSHVVEVSRFIDW